MLTAGRLRAKSTAPRKGGVRPHRLPAEAAEGPEGDLGEGVERCHRRSDEDIGAGGAR